MTTANPDLDNLLKLYFHLLDLSRDVERNAEDSEFQKEGGRIHYVFDATVLEVFINPQDWRGEATSLHGGIWYPGQKIAPSEHEIAAQTALATSEYLFSGALPCQDRSAIFMTEWHRWEFKRRIDQLQVEQVARVRSATPEEVMGRFKDIRSLLETFDRKPEKVARQLEGSALAGDLVQYRTHNPDSDALRNFLLTRLAVAKLAGDSIVEPSEQLRRLVTAPLRHFLHTLHLFMPPGPTDLERIREDAKAWMRRLRSECALNGITIVSPRDPQGEVGDRGRRRSEGAVWDDARSIALTRWAAAHKSETSTDEHVLFVTADHIAFDAYRRWYADLRMDEEAYGEPFFMRRLAQYAPAFNLVSSGRLEGAKYQELFQDLLQALETMLLPLNLSRSASKAPAVVVSRMRERTALRPIEPGPIALDALYAPLVHALTQSGIHQHLARVNSLIDRWRELERVALGRADEKVQIRIQNAQAAEEVFAKLDPDASLDAYEEYVSNLVRTLVSGSLEVSLPLAREFIDNWPSDFTESEARAPIALQLDVETRNGTLPVGQMLEDRLTGGKRGPLLAESDWVDLYRGPGLVFAIAAAHCMASRDWNNGQKFATMALEAITPVAGPGVGSDQEAEIRYLNALANRFRMGEVGPPLTGEAFTRVDRLYKNALRHLNQIEAHHIAGNQTLRLIRTCSERAALRLFFACSLNPWMRFSAARRQPRMSSRRFSPGSPGEADLLDLGADNSARKAIEDAELDLLNCLRMDHELGEVEEPRRLDFRKRVRRQFLTNIGCVAVLRVLWRMDNDGAPSMLQPQNPHMARQLKAVFQEREDGAHPIIKADLLGFLALGGDLEAFAGLTGLPALDLNSRNLPLDVAMLDAILANIRSFAVEGPGGMSTRTW